jgi:hypothetical protein
LRRILSEIRIRKKRCKANTSERMKLLLLPSQGEGWDGGGFDCSMNVKSHPHLNLPPHGEDFKATVSIRRL